MILNKEFDKVVCINLVNRLDKRTEMQKRFDKYNINVDWFTAVQYGFSSEVVNSLKGNSGMSFPRFNINHPNEFGAAMSHYTVIKQALEEGVEKLFVFEDDAMFRKNFDTSFDKSFYALPVNWDMFLLYSFMYNIQPQNVRVNAKWIKAYDSWSLMAYGINKKAMEVYISEMDKKFRIADLVSFEMQRMDLNIYSSVPTLCIPNTKIGSNIRGDNMNYENTNTVLNLGYDNTHFE